ncbi:MAG TPA: type 2 isopentenyl-diphosphate Delta-isomerase [Patescibacteria group bacterium]|nr:type 2 isopentenyl-diphosphate Delta-isomerase [Patescibacteria group bacterium]
MSASPGKSDNFDDIQRRKGDHIRLCLDPGSQADFSVFDAYSLPYTALPEVMLDDVDTSFTLLGKTLSMPFIIASMTGGSEHGRKINTNLAMAAEHCGVAMGVGSQRIGLEKQDAADTFKLVRKCAPNACIVANMGAVQLNYGHGIDSYRKVVDMIEADALYLHLNPLQEALQPGGDTDFRGLTDKIQQLVEQVGVPVFVKEVGHGISAEVARTLFDIGVQAIDVAGVGGTSYAWVEAERAQNKDFAAWFKTVGIPTDQSVIETASARAKKGQLVIASGGVRSPLDGLKARALGADLFSAAVPFLEPAMESTEAVVATIENWKRGLQVGMFSAGARDWDRASGLAIGAVR